MRIVTQELVRADWRIVGRRVVGLVVTKVLCRHRGVLKVKLKIGAMDIYTIKQGYPDVIQDEEIEISSPNLVYSEIGDIYSGCQCSNIDNQPLIHEKCRQISGLIKEIDALNKSQKDTTIQDLNPKK